MGAGVKGFKIEPRRTGYLQHWKVGGVHAFMVKWTKVLRVNVNVNTWRACVYATISRCTEKQQKGIFTLWTRPLVQANRSTMDDTARKSYAKLARFKSGNNDSDLQHELHR